MSRLITAFLVFGAFAPTQATLRGRGLSGITITKFRLIDAVTNEPVLDPLDDGSVYYVRSSRALDLTVEAVTGGVVGSVRIDGRTENAAPYARCGDKNGKFAGCRDLNKLGSHIISAIAYAKSNAKGKASNALSITFTVAEAPTSVPTDSPVVSPTDSPFTSPTKSPVVSPTETPVSSPVASPTCNSDEYFDGLQEKQCRKFCTSQRGCSNLEDGGGFPNYFIDDFLCADTAAGNQCAAKVANEQCGGCGTNEQCVQTNTGYYMCACKYKFGRNEGGSCTPVCYDSYPYGNCGKNGSCQNTKRGPLCTEIGGNPYCNGSCAADQFCGRYTVESNFWDCLPL